MRVTFNPIVEAINTDSVTLGLSLECFRQCLTTTVDVYKKKVQEIFRHIGRAAEDGKVFHEQVLTVIEAIHALVERSVEEDSTIGVPSSSSDSKKMQQNLLYCLEILYSLLPPDQVESSSVVSWLYDFCVTRTIDGRYLDGIFKLLFTQRLKYFDGDFFTSVAILLSRVFGTIAEVEGEQAFEMKAISEVTAEAVFLHLCGVLKRDIEFVDGTILKAKSMAAKISFMGDKGADDDRKLIFI